MSDLHIVITTAGTSGDAIPFIALGKELKARGHKLTLMTSADHEPLSSAHGVGFVATGDADWPQIGRDERAYFREQLLPAYIRIERHIRSLVEQGERVFVVVRVGNWGGLFACERHNLAFVIAVPQPASVWDNGQPICDEDRHLINAWRRDLGLAEIPGPTVPEPSEATIGLFPDWFGHPDGERLPKGICVGFPFLDREETEGTALPDSVQSFIEAEGRPVVFTAGTGVQDIAKLARVAREFQMETDRPVIFLSHFCEALSGAETAMFRVLPFVDHALLFPHCAMVIHNGGIGTIAQAMRAGIPQVVVPLVWDQPDNTARIEALGVGRGIELADLTSRSLAEALDHFESMDRKRLMLVAAAVRADDAIGLAADQVERSMRAVSYL